MKKCNMKWLENYALPVSMLSAMVFAAVITPVIGGWEDEKYRKKL